MLLCTEILTVIVLACSLVSVLTDYTLKHTVYSEATDGIISGITQEGNVSFERKETNSFKDAWAPMVEYCVYGHRLSGIVPDYFSHGYIRSLIDSKVEIWYNPEKPWEFKCYDFKFWYAARTCIIGITLIGFVIDAVLVCINLMLM